MTSNMFTDYSNGAMRKDEWEDREKWGEKTEKEREEYTEEGGEDCEQVMT